MLDQAVLPLVKESALFGAYYHRKKEQDKMLGAKGIVAVARLFLKTLFGWYKSGQAFNRDRVFACEARYAMVA